MIKISFIIPAWKSDKFIEECLNSIQNQLAFKDSKIEYEILVGIDGCQKTKDKLIQIKDKYKNLKVYWSPKNNGAYIMRNSLAQKSDGNILLFFDSDDTLNPNAIETILKHLENEKTEIIRFKYNKNKYANGVFCITKEAFEKMGGFNNWLCKADREFHIKAKKHGFFYNNIPIIIMTYNHHKNQLTKLYKKNSLIRMEYAKQMKNKNYNWDIPIIPVTTQLIIL